MDWVQVLAGFFSDYTLRTVALGSLVLGMVSGALGSFAVLRKQSLLGDAISHAALPGVVGAFLLTRSKAPLVLVIGAIVSGWLATVWFMGIVKHTRVKEDSALAFVLSTFFGVGLALLTFTQRLPDSRQAGLDRFLFGQAAALLEQDVVTMAVLGGLVLLVLMIFWKEFKLLAFDREYATSLGFPMGALDLLLTSLLVVAIVIGLQAVGVVLMSAMVVAPASAARQWTDRLGMMVLLSALFGALAGVAGTVISSLVPGFSTGPTIVLCISAVVLVSVLFSPNRGLLANWVRQRRSRRRLRLERVLADLYLLGEQHPGDAHGHPAQVLRVMNPNQDIESSLAVLKERGWAAQTADGSWLLTNAGRSAAQAAAVDQGLSLPGQLTGSEERS